MKHITLLSLVFPFFLFIICSCSGNSRNPRKPVTTVELIPNLKQYTYGQPLKIKIKTNIKEGEIKRVDLFLNQNLLNSGNQSEFTFDIPSLNETGLNTILVYAEKTDGLSNKRLHNFSVLSDIVPFKYNYSVIREFPHSTDHFTQGLQIFNEYLYEGTGEYGKSSLYKKNLTNGRIVMQKPLKERYFGEGITVMNGKIYQLTYKDQVGFVYNLSDFALIDSFRYDSKEGWGLTNDGKSLIMSNGTGVLTWLDSQNFEVLKRLQITDNKNIYQYINELEYDNGYIWANVWTTNQIIKIDSKTGKVEGYIDLKGILGIMTQNPSERVDVMNGIAVFPESGNLLITGKLWPKMFEIKISE